LSGLACDEERVECAASEPEEEQEDGNQDEK
jgi:hypothetical protein